MLKEVFISGVFVKLNEVWKFERYFEVDQVQFCKETLELLNSLNRWLSWPVTGFFSSRNGYRLFLLLIVIENIFPFVLFCSCCFLFFIQFLLYLNCTFSRGVCVSRKFKAEAYSSESGRIVTCVGNETTAVALQIEVLRQKSIFFFH